MRPTLPLIAGVALVLALSGCGSDTEGSGSDAATTITVSSTDDACTLSATSAVAGPTTFSITNDGGQVTEFYLYGQDGESIVGEVENIGPGLSRDLAAVLEPGSYETACKPGMAGDGIRASFTVTGSTS